MRSAAKRHLAEIGRVFLSHLGTECHGGRCVLNCDLRLNRDSHLTRSTVLDTMSEDKEEELEPLKYLEHQCVAQIEAQPDFETQMGLEREAATQRMWAAFHNSAAAIAHLYRGLCPRFNPENTLSLSQFDFREEPRQLTLAALPDGCWNCHGPVQR